MGYQLRLQPSGVLFHVMNRGNNKNTIFHDSPDFVAYLELLHFYKTALSVKIYHYVLMPNHVHLLIETMKPNTLSRFMQSVTSGYARYYRKKYGGVGHVWQARYKSIPIEADLYYLQCANYIEQNPVRSMLVPDAKKYLWSSAGRGAETHNLFRTDIHPLLIEAKKTSNYPATPTNKPITELTEFSFSSSYGSTEFLERLWCQRRL